jgi:hypothetical protein
MKSLHTLLSREMLAKSPLIPKLLQDAFNRFNPQVKMARMGYCGKLDPERAFLQDCINYAAAGE